MPAVPWLAAIVIAPFVMLSTADRLDARPPSGLAWTTYRDGALWLARNTPAGSRVFTTGWDDFPHMFFWNTHNTYLVGLDPTYTVARGPGAVPSSGARSRMGRVPTPSQPIREQFGSPYVLTDLQPRALPPDGRRRPRPGGVLRTEPSSSTACAVADRDACSGALDRPRGRRRPPLVSGAARRSAWWGCACRAPGARRAPPLPDRAALARRLPAVRPAARLAARRPAAARPDGRAAWIDGAPGHGRRLRPGDPARAGAPRRSSGRSRPGRSRPAAGCWCWRWRGAAGYPLPPAAARREHRLRCRPHGRYSRAAPRRPLPVRGRAGRADRSPSPRTGEGFG